MPNLCQVHTECDCVYDARSFAYSSPDTWHFSEFAPGRFALYNECREVVLITDDWREVLRHYRNRASTITIQGCAAIAVATGLEIDI